ncbi:MAG: sulfurtransferase TusA family protein [Bacteroides sp.]|jgi:TusA-related sulfurtransferase|nr:sulfurtransferase TusA family protein [Bacteroides sp.]MCI1682192.1 sulfurtransferase TusA family protein [Bacteroides sp.]
MKSINTCGQKQYSPLIPAIEAICKATPGDKLEIIMDNTIAFSDLKEYLIERNIGFREIYDGEQMAVQFIV